MSGGNNAPENPKPTSPDFNVSKRTFFHTGRFGQDF
jgi:hypothetical protein